MSTFVVIAMTIAFASQASAQGAIEIGGRTAITGTFSVIANDPKKGSKNQTLIFGGTVTRSSKNGRFEYGGGLLFIGLFGGGNSLSIVTPSGQVRVNTNLLGSDENILLYGGFVVGVTFINLNEDDDDFRKALGAFGPKFGAEYYFNSNLALQIEDLLLIDSEGGVINNVTLGIKLLF